MTLMYFVICFGFFMGQAIGDDYIYSLHPFRYFGEYGGSYSTLILFAFIFIEVGAVFLVLTSRVKEIEYEYQTKKNEKEKHSIFKLLISNFFLSFIVLLCIIFAL